ncbi:Ribosomal RNA small subunit methyltransferase I [Rickettsiales endosymbiont of Paramecium tredecaurelia]|uniref:16S rRNA (cytidine(1402)-2'-O)-methyltransferase n=1 Tax=Candidatus Sarmatiella mevalonica TaxID=2770581 RepID=UPI0019218C62|nr:16S rRNA (cytidine(1402)-2'-O)-methyltransferase [Candidatus Sarmatiella mevalonica]MBL3284471.1 Ribosomal RNA small subunit methyltransferase I [Candidatus Sarmatiella mevalonica]
MINNNDQVHGLNTNKTRQYEAGLYLISTPIGNLQDITFRAVEVLAQSDLILCENTQESQKLLSRYNIHSKYGTYNDYNHKIALNQIKQLIAAGCIVSLISDAGTPLISDPGYKLARDLKQEGYHVDAIPGPCSLIMALSLCTLPTDSFYFGGFIPKTEQARRNFFQKASGIHTTLIFFERQNRLVSSLQIALEIFGDAQAAIARELTKLHQEILTESLSSLINTLSTRNIKGEVILLISNATPIVKEDEMDELIIEMLANKMSVKEIVSSVLNIYPNGKKNQIYRRANELKNQ